MSVRYPTGRQRFLPTPTVRFLRFEKDYAPATPTLSVIVTDTVCYEEIIIPPPIAVAAGIVTQAEVDRVAKALAKTPEQLAEIRSRLDRQPALTAAAHEQADRDATCINCVANWRDVFGIPESVAKAMCRCDSGFWRSVLQWGAIGAAALILIPITARALWRVATR